MLKFSDLSVEEKIKYVAGLTIRHPDGITLKEAKKVIGNVDAIVAVLRWIRGHAQTENQRYGNVIASLPGLWIGGKEFIANGYFSNEDGSLCYRGGNDILGYDIHRVVLKGDTISFNS